MLVGRDHPQLQQRSASAVTGQGRQPCLPIANQSLVAASLYVDYVFLDTDERRRMAQNPHEYLIEQLQFTGDESVGSSSNKIKLNFNHPCKELIWVVQPDANVDYCSSLVCDATLFKLSVPSLSTTPMPLMLSPTPSMLSVAESCQPTNSLMDTRS